MKSKYEEYVEPRFDDIEKWVKNGLSEKQIAHNLGIGYTTFRDFKKTHPSLSSLLVCAKKVPDEIVENAYYKRAIGYDVEEEKKAYEVTQDPVTGEDVYRLVSVIKHKRHIPGDVSAAENWLAHRMPEKWGRIDSITDGEEDTKRVLIIPKRQLIEEVTYEEHMDTTT